VAVVGSPNVGKSTLVNAFIGQRLCITTSKAQTTRHSILGLATGPGYQIALTDTPGVIEEPAYALQKSMVVAAKRACRDAEVVLLLTDIFETEDASSRLRQWVGDLTLNGTQSPPLVVAVNKVDLIRGVNETTGEGLLGPIAMDLVGSEAQALRGLAAERDDRRRRTRFEGSHHIAAPRFGPRLPHGR